MDSLAYKAALKKVKDVIAAIKTDTDDKTALYGEDDILKALATIRAADKRKFAQLQEQFREFKCKVEIDKALKRFSKNNKVNKKPTFPTLPAFSVATSGISLHLSCTKPTLKDKIKSLTADSLIVVDQETGEILPVPHSEAVSILVNKCFHGVIAYSTDGLVWHGFTGKCWAVSKHKSLIDALLIEQLYIGMQSSGFSQSYKNGVKALLTDSGFLELPANDNHNVLPFLNGMLNLSNNELTPQTPANALTWCLPYDYLPNADCPNIKSFLFKAVDDDAETVEFLRAWLAALLHGRADLQRFLHLKGSGGTGKSTFMRLATLLIGEQNAVTSNLKTMEQNQFETANFYNKRLIKITDSDKYGGSIDVLKALTGQDHVRLERKNEQQGNGFIYGGLVIIASNESLAFTDHSSGLERRRLTVSFDRRVTSEEKANWDKLGGEENVLHSEVSGLVNWLLELSQEDITNTIRNPPKRTQDANIDAMQAGNPVANWLHDCCVPELEEWTQVGVKSEIREQGEEIKYKDSDTQLYPNYLLWCSRHNRAPLSSRRFRDVVIDTTKTLGHDCCSLRRSSAQGIQGIRLKKDWEQGKNGFNVG